MADEQSFDLRILLSSADQFAESHSQRACEFIGDFDSDADFAQLNRANVGPVHGSAFSKILLRQPQFLALAANSAAEAPPRKTCCSWHDILLVSRRRSFYRRSSAGRFRKMEMRTMPAGHRALQGNNTGCGLRQYLRASLEIVLIYLTLTVSLFAQSAHLAVCQTPAAMPTSPQNAPLISKVVAALGDPNALASLKAIRYTAELSAGTTSAAAVRVEMIQTRIYPDHLMLITHTPGGPENHLEASPAGAFTQVSGRPKTNLPGAMSDELLKIVHLDRFYVGQNILSGKVSVTETGTERIGDVEAAALRLNVDGAEATWYVDPKDGRLLRTVEKVHLTDSMVDPVADYSDWRNCDGLMVSFQRDHTQGEKVSREKVLTVELNPSIAVSETENETVATESNAPKWTREDQTDPLRGTQFAQFTLRGKYLTPPRDVAPHSTPAIVVRCIPGRHSRGHTNGEFLEGYLHVGGVVDSEISGEGHASVSVEFRLDDGKLQYATWSHSTDYSSVFFSADFGSGWGEFANLLYAHRTYHKEDTNPQVRKVVIGLQEFLGAEVVMQFDMPDATDVGEACGVIWHK